MSKVVLSPGDTWIKTPNEQRVIEFDYDTLGNLTAGAAITNSTWTVTLIGPVGGTVPTTDNPSLTGSNRKTQVRVSGGSLGCRAYLVNKITTNENPNQVKEFQITIQVQAK
jgi:hypothetical protein